MIKISKQNANTNALVIFDTAETNEKLSKELPKNYAGIAATLKGVEK